MRHPPLRPPSVSSESENEKSASADFDLGDFAVMCWRSLVNLFPLDFENQFYCFLDIDERFFPGLTLAYRPGDLDALDCETAFFLGFENHRILPG